MSLDPPNAQHVSRFHIVTFGCQMNVHDSQRMEESLRAHGWQAAQGEHDADLIVLNTCSVREKAEHKLRSEVGRLKVVKRARPELVIAVAGCVAQQEGEKLLAAIAHIDIVVGPDNLQELAALVEVARLGGPPVARTVFDVENPTFLGAQPTHGSATGSAISAFVTTMKGCDERCSFCVVPYTRGPERYRPLDEIIDEVKRLVEAGVREVTLLGQTVNSWLPPDQVRARSEAGSHDPRPSLDDDRSQFPELLRAIAQRVPQLGRLRYTSPHPRHVTQALVAAHAELEVLARHVHLPSQSGSDRMLRRMIRRYTRNELVERAAWLAASRPGTTLSTDIIVGFPGETDADFAMTLEMVREVGFVALFGFKFSPRPHTPALRLADDVPEAVKSERLAQLFETVEVQQRRHLASLVGSRVRVLFEGTSRPSQSNGHADGVVPSTGAMRMMGRSERNEIVHVDIPRGRDGLALVGRFVELGVASANAHSLVGALDEDDVRTLPERVTQSLELPREPRVRLSMLGDLQRS